MDWATIIGLLTALFSGGVLAKLIDGVSAWFRGRHGKEQTAWEQRDAEARQRRRLEETLHATRQQLASHGVQYEDMPPWPARGTT